MTIKIMKTLRFLTITLISMMFFSLASCSSDDNDETMANGLVGTWECSDHYIDLISFEDGTDYYTFKSNGTYEWRCRGHNSHSGKYSYNKESGLLTITNQKGTTWVYVIAALTDSFFVMIDEDGDRYTYTKQ